MAERTEVVFVDGVRTPFGRAGEKGQYWSTRADDLVVKAMVGLLERNPQLPKDQVEDVAIAATSQVGDQALMGADMDAAWAPNIAKPKNGFDVTLHTPDLIQGRRWFDQLSAGGKAVMPFNQTFWSPGFGSLIDKFGIPWMINVVPEAGWKPAQG